MGKIEDLEKIKKLKDNGILTEEEFNAEKVKILNENNIDNTNNETNIVEEVVETKEKTTPNNVELKSTKKIQKILFIVTGILIIVAIALFCVHTSCKTNARGIVTNSFEEYRTFKSSLSRISDTCEIISIIFGVISLVTLCVGFALKIRDLKIKNGKIFKSADKKKTKELSKEELKNIRRKSNKITLIIIGICFLISLFIAGVSLLSNNIITNIVEQKKIEIEELNKRTVPNVEGMTYTEAKETLEEAGFECNASSQWGYTYDGYVVYEQSPKADTESSKGESVKISLKKIITEESDNYYGMRFTKTISEFCEDYNTALETVYENFSLSSSTLKKYKITESDFSYYQQQETTKLRIYRVVEDYYELFIYLESDSDYIVSARVRILPSLYSTQRYCNGYCTIFIVCKCYEFNRSFF